MMTKRRAVSAWFGFDLGRTTGKDGRRVKEEEEAEGWGCWVQVKNVLDETVRCHSRVISWEM